MTTLIDQITPAGKAIELKELPVFLKEEYQLLPFDGRTIQFLDRLSRSILKDRTVNYLPEMAALGFWLRKGNILELKEANSHVLHQKQVNLAPVGRVFHVCPANVDTMFVYSMTVALLMGNKNILRVSSRMESRQILQLFFIINGLMDEEEFSLFREYINIIQYPHNDFINNEISQRVNARLIWGGDQTIQTFKGFTSGPRTKDITFADRTSAYVIDCDFWMNAEDSEKKKFIQNFFNDAYTFDQMGCSSPQYLFLLNDKGDFSEEFLKEASAYIEVKYGNDVASIASLKINRLVNDAIDGTIRSKKGNSFLVFAELEQNAFSVELHSCGAGYFYTKKISDINELCVLQSRKVQTVSYYGLKASDLEKLISLAGGEGIDRIVPAGRTLDFHYIWDGYNLFDELSRKVFIYR
jgi:hypothetical protein